MQQDPQPVYDLLGIRLHILLDSVQNGTQENIGIDPGDKGLIGFGNSVAVHVLPDHAESQIVQQGLQVLFQLLLMDAAVDVENKILFS